MFQSSWVFLESLRQSSDIFGNVLLAFGRILENPRSVVGNLREIVKNAVISMSI